MEESIKYRSCFDIIGPIMIGPSSSHTAGACAIGYAAYQLFSKVPDKVKITYYESFAVTHQGHGTDFALISGILGFDPSDDRVPYALQIARERGMEISFIESKEASPANHANTALLELSDNDGNTLKVLGVSIGGGAFEIREIDMQGIIIKPKETRNLVLFSYVESFDNKLFDDVINDLETEILNKQISVLGNITLVLLNPKRQLAKIELDAIKKATNASKYTTIYNLEDNGDNEDV